MGHVLAMNGRTFEKLIAALWKKRGFLRVILTPQSNDHGVDVVALKGDGTGILVQCKASGQAGQRLGWDAIKEIVGGTSWYSAQHPGVKFERVCVTNQGFNSTASAHAEMDDVQLISGDDLAGLLATFPVSRFELEAA